MATRSKAAAGVTLTDGVELWERQEGETRLRYGQFRAYRDQGVNRTLRETAETLGKSYDHIRHVAAAFLWSDRAAAWDAHLVAQFTARWGDERIKAAERDARLLQALTAKAAEGLRALNGAALSPNELLRLIDVVLRHSRALFGDPAAVQTAAGMIGAETGDGHPLAAEIAAFAGMSPAARKTRLVELTQEAEARAAALSGADDD
jgi:hypothetical protein